MELYKEILVNALAKEEIHVVFPDLKFDLSEIVAMECYIALQKIKTIIENDSLSDAECFVKIEEIVRTFEELGSGGGARHDFG